MRSGIDLSSWQSIVSTMLGLILVSVVAVGIRLVFMQRVQRRRERENRQINERLKTLIAAYKTLGGSFTGNLEVDPAHLRDLRSRGDGPGDDDAATAPGSNRRRRMRDAVEAALSDVILLGTEEQVRLAVAAADDMVAGRAVKTAALVASLRTFVRDALDLDPVPAGLAIPLQGPLRPASGGGGSRGGGRPGGGGGSTGGRGAAGGGGAGMGGGALGGGAAAAGLGAHADADGADPSDASHR